MSGQPRRGLLEVLQQLPDPRGRTGRRHPLSAMLAAVVCATLCGFCGYRQIIGWLQLHGVEMWHLLGFTRRPPVRQSFSNLLCELDVELLQQVLRELIGQLAEPPVANSSAPASSKSTAAQTAVEVWDGKTLRGTRHGETRAEQVLVRIETQLGTVLSSTHIPRETNEAKTAFELVRSLVLEGKLVVADAAYCQRDICQAVLDSGGDYLVTVKGNQPQLQHDVEQSFVIPQSFSPLQREAGTRPA